MHYDFLSLERSSAFQQRQMRSLFSRYYKLGSYYQGKMKKYQEAEEVNHRRKTNLVDKLDELKRRQAFLQGRKERLLAAKDNHAVYRSVLSGYHYGWGVLCFNSPALGDLVIPRLGGQRPQGPLGSRIQVTLLSSSLSCNRATLHVKSTITWHFGSLIFMYLNAHLNVNHNNVNSRPLTFSLHLQVCPTSCQWIRLPGITPPYSTCWRCPRWRRTPFWVLSQVLTSRTSPDSSRCSSKM